MHISGRFGTCPYSHVSYKIYLANALFGQVWNLPLRACIRIGLGGFRTRPYGGVSDWVRAGLEPAPTMRGYAEWFWNLPLRYRRIKKSNQSHRLKYDYNRDSLIDERISDSHRIRRIQ